MQQNNYYCFKGKPLEIEEHLAINQSLLEDLIRWHDREAMEEFQKVKLGTMSIYGWSQEDYNNNFNYYKTQGVRKWKKQAWNGLKNIGTIENL